MKVVYKPLEMNNLIQTQSGSVGFVPTMGALHEGHISLINRSINDNAITVVSIFVNPTQFNDPDDLAMYPKQKEDDLKILESLNVDYVFIPGKNLIYKDSYRYRIIENDLSKKLCGSKREGHFEGVLTIVMKLLNIVSPTRAYFGEKDYQQFLLIKGMIESFFMNIEIIPVRTVRESDGLAFSSRNMLLSKEDRMIAPKFCEILKAEIMDEEAEELLSKEGFIVDYVETIDNRRFGAVFLGNVRLIDNVEK
jgi:pantoate--beta-alanine ligase